MRDTAATHLLNGTWGPKWPIKEVSEHLGHSSVKVTEDRYAHLTIDAKVATARATESERKHRANTGRHIFAASSNPLKSLAPEVGLAQTELAQRGRASRGPTAGAKKKAQPTGWAASLLRK